MARASHSRWLAIIQAALVPLSIGLTAGSGLILALTLERSWVAGLIAAAAAVLAFATRLNPLWLLLAGGAWVLLALSEENRYAVSGTSLQVSQTNGREARLGGERSMSDMPSHAPVKSIMPNWVRGPQDFIGEMVTAWDRRRRNFTDALNRVQGLSCPLVDGAFYAFVDIRGTGLDSIALSDKLLNEAQVSGTPGIAFGEAGEGHIRFSFATSDEMLEKAARRIGDCLGWKS